MEVSLSRRCEVFCAGCEAMARNLLGEKFDLIFATSQMAAGFASWITESTVEFSPQIQFCCCVIW